MPSIIRAERISRALYEADPLNTCCKENESFDEYDHIANSIEVRLSGGCRFEEALIAEISEWFFEGKNFDSGILDSTIQLYNKMS